MSEVVIGVAGTGKTYYAINKMLELNCRYTVALTPAAALLTQIPDDFNVKMTVEAFLRRDLPMNFRSGLYIDEISMVPADKLEQVLKKSGGGYVIMSGDPFQIPPISDAGEAEWWFKSKEYIALDPKLVHLTEQRRMLGEKWRDVREILGMIERQDGGWKEKMFAFLMESRRERRGGEELLVFKHEDGYKEARNWAEERGIEIKRGDCLAVGMRGVIKRNLIDDKRSGKDRVVYVYRNGERGEIVKIKEKSIDIKVDGTTHTVNNGGLNSTIPYVRCAVAGVVDSAQGKTYDEPVHVIFNDYIPPPSKILVAISRSRGGFSCEINNLEALRYQFESPHFKFDDEAKEFMQNILLKK